MEDLNLDPTALKKKKPKDPLEERFSPQPLQAPPPPTKTVPPAATNVGSAATAAQAPVRQQPTTFTNFSRVQAANADVSKREAGMYGRRAEENALRAKNQRDALVERFGGEVQKGTVANPGGMTADAPLTAAQEAAMNTNAEGMYEGPGGLGDVEGAEGVYASTLGAEQNLDALGSDAGVSALIQQRNQFNSEGNNALSGSLIGGAGRKDFDALRARFNPEADLMKAETDAAGAADKARTDSDANAKSWGSMRDTRAAAAEAQRLKDAEGDAPSAAQDTLASLPISQLNNPMAGVDKRDPVAVAKAKADFEQFRMAIQKDAGDEFRTAMHAMSPLTNLVGDVAKSDWVTPFEGAGNQVGQMVHGNEAAKKANGGGVYTGQHIPWQFETDWPVYRSMTSADWARLRGMNTHAQKRWIAQRRDDIYAAASKNPEPLPGRK